jgi:hypothetical protein
MFLGKGFGGFSWVFWGGFYGFLAEARDWGLDLGRGKGFNGGVSLLARELT